MAVIYQTYKALLNLVCQARLLPGAIYYACYHDVKASTSLQSVRSCLCFLQIDGSQDIGAVGSAIEDVLDTFQESNSLEQFQRELQASTV